MYMEDEEGDAEPVPLVTAAQNDNGTSSDAMAGIEPHRTKLQLPHVRAAVVDLVMRRRLDGVNAFVRATQL